MALIFAQIINFHIQYPNRLQNLHFFLLNMRALLILSIETYSLSNVIKSVNDTTLLLFHTHTFIYILTFFIIETNY